MMPQLQSSNGARPSRAQQRPNAQHVRLIPTLVALLSCCSGCAIFGGYSSGPLASVTISNQPREKIEEATTAVFVLEGYQSAPGPANQLTFQRAASTEDNVAYG